MVATPAATLPQDACTAQTVSSTETNCGPDSWMSISVRPSVGRISASRARHGVRPVQLGRDLHRQLRAPHRGLGGGRVGDRADEVAAEGEPDLDLAARIAWMRLHGVDAVLAGRLEAELVAEGVEERLRHLLPDAHGAVALHVAVPADGGGAGARLADVAAQQQQVDDLLDRVDALLVLREAHRPGDDDAVGLEVAGGQLVDLVGCAGPSPRAPCSSSSVGEVRLELVEALQCSARNSWSSTVPGLRGLGLEHALGHGLQQRHVAADADLQELVGDLGAVADDAPRPSAGSCTGAGRPRAAG